MNLWKVIEMKLKVRLMNLKSMKNLKMLRRLFNQLIIKITLMKKHPYKMIKVILVIDIKSIIKILDDYRMIL